MHRGHFAVKEAVFPFLKFPGCDVLLGPEMRSTGEVMGISDDFGLAYAKSQLGAGNGLPTEGCVFLSVKDADKAKTVELGHRLIDMGFSILATEGTHEFFAENDIPSEMIQKLQEGRPNILDAITNGEIHLVVNTPIGKKSQWDDSYIRKSAIKYKIPYITTLAAANAAAEGITALRQDGSEVHSLQEHHSRLQ